MNSLNSQISIVAGRIEGFEGLASLLNSSPKLSEQAKSILKQIVESGAKMVMERKMHTGQPDQYIFIDGAVGQVQYTEANFISEDFDALVSTNLLRVEFTSKRNRKFFATRAGVEYVSGVDG